MVEDDYYSATRLPHLQSLTHHPGPAAAPPAAPPRGPGAMKPPSRWLPPPPPLPPLPPLLRPQPPPPRPQPKSLPSPPLRQTLTLLLLVLLGAPSLSYAAKGGAETASLTSTGTASPTSTATPLRPQPSLPPPAAKSKLNGFVQRAVGLGAASPR